MGEFNKGTFSDTEETITALNVFYILFGISHMSNLPWMIYRSCNSDTGIVIHKTLPGRVHLSTCAKTPGELAAYLKNEVKIYIFI